MTKLRLLVCVVVLAVTVAGCAIPRRHHVLIDRYTAATCIALSSGAMREWNTTLRPGPAREVRIIGHQRVSGMVVARDERTGEEHMVANAGDYIYPADVRTSPDFGRVFVKADGLMRYAEEEVNDVRLRCQG